MDDPRLHEILCLLDPPPGTRLWYGGVTVTGSLRGITPGQAKWKPDPKRHSIWELTLHLAYWEYAVRRNVEGLPRGTFPRSRSNWPVAPAAGNASHWKKDRELLRSEHVQLVQAIRAFDPRRLDEVAPGSKQYRYVDLLFGVVSHDLYHVGQIQMLKRMYKSQKR